MTSYQYSYLTGWRIHVETSIQHCLSFAFIVSEMAFTAVLVLESPHNVQVNYIVLRAWIKLVSI